MTRSARLRLAAIAAAASLSACATPAVVMISPDYGGAKISRVALISFSDFPGATGSGEIAASSFEKYLLLAGYRLMERRQALALLKERDLEASDDMDPAQARGLAQLLGVDALVFGRLTDFTNSSEQTVMVDVPQEESDPLYGQVTSTQRVGGARVTTTQTVVTGYSVTQTDNIVPETEFVPARAALAARLVDARSGEVLWSVSADGDGDSLSAAVEAASAKAMRTLAKRLKAAAAAAR